MKGSALSSMVCYFLSVGFDLIAKACDWKRR